MRFRTYFLALVAIALLHPVGSQAQSTTPPRAEQPAPKSARMNGSASARHAAAPLGFAFRMTPGVANAYGYPAVVRITAGSSAARAGLAVGDTILSINGRDARQGQMFPDHQPGTRYVLRVRRGGEERELTYLFPTALTRP